jgi:hypothetical protein
VGRQKREFQLGGHDDLIPALQAFSDSLENVRELKVSGKREFGTGTGALILAGLPGINLQQDSPGYKSTHHSAADALEAVKPDVLTQNSTILALTLLLAGRSARGGCLCTARRARCENAPRQG